VGGDDILGEDPCNDNLDYLGLLMYEREIPIKIVASQLGDLAR
jgi:hypothetical protein